MMEKTKPKAPKPSTSKSADLLLITVGPVSCSMDLLFIAPEGNQNRQQTVYNSQKLGSRWHVDTSGSEQRIPADEYTEHLRTTIETEILGRSSLPAILTGQPARAAHIRGSLGAEVQKSFDAGERFDLYEIGIGARSAFAHAS